MGNFQDGRCYEGPLVVTLNLEQLIQQAKGPMLKGQSCMCEPQSWRGVAVPGSWENISEEILFKLLSQCKSHPSPTKHRTVRQIRSLEYKDGQTTKNCQAIKECKLVNRGSNSTKLENTEEIYVKLFKMPFINQIYTYNSLSDH